jgi:hypothetical protein
MLDLKDIPAELHDFVQHHLVPEFDDVKTRLLTAVNLLTEHAQNALAAAERELAMAQKVAPLLGGEGEALIEAAQKGLEVAQAFLNKVSGGV